MTTAAAMRMVDLGVGPAGEITTPAAITTSGRRALTRTSGGGLSKRDEQEEEGEHRPTTLYAYAPRKEGGKLGGNVETGRSGKSGPTEVWPWGEDPGRTTPFSHKRPSRRRCCSMKEGVLLPCPLYQTSEERQEECNPEAVENVPVRQNGNNGELLIIMISQNYVEFHV